jgi:hypothetical protein
MNVCTPKQRMLNAYRGVFSDRRPVAPEFWYLFPAKVLGVSMVEFEREVPFWQALQTTFKKYGTEGWGAAFPEVTHPDADILTRFQKISDTRYRESASRRYKGKVFDTAKIFDLQEPSWVESHLVKDLSDLPDCVDMLLNSGNVLDFGLASNAHAGVGEDFLLEMWMGNPFFDFIGEMVGFEKAVLYFTSEEEEILEAYRERYIEYQTRFIREACEKTPFESFAMGCSYSCNSLLGPSLWRKWDKPYIKAISDEIHRHGKLLHVHFHGRAMEAVADFAEIGIDCVCPFERGPGGDVDGLEGLREVRRLLDDKVTMNGNVHTVETLIRGRPEDARREVRQIREAFSGSARLIIGTGDQVGRETPEENIHAMIDEAKRSSGTN